MITGTTIEITGQYYSSWYAFVRGDAYKGFQQFGVVFPFEYIVEDTVGTTTNLNFHSVNEIAQWRSNQNPGSYAWELAHFGAPDRVVWEGYPGETYGVNKHQNFPNTSDSTSVILTYLFPGNKVTYFFRQEAGIWRVYKRLQKKYSRQALAENSARSFDEFLLRFISDNPFRLSSIKWPLKRVDMPAEGEPVSITYLKQEQYYHKDTWRGTSLMNLRHGLSPQKVQMDTMFLHSKEEGGINYGSVFVKKNKRYVLTESWDASN